MSKYLNESKLYLNNHCLKNFAEIFSRHLVKLKWHQKGKNNLTTPISLDSDNECQDRDTPGKFAKKMEYSSKLLKNVRLMKVNRLTLAQLNINSG